MRRISFLLTFLLIASLAIAAPPDSTVAVYANFKAGRFCVGTGSIITSSGYILTSTTTIEATDAESVTVTLTSNEKVQARIVAIDLDTEFALIKIEPPRKLTPFKIRASETARIGEVVITVASNLVSPSSNAEMSTSVGLLSGRYNAPRKMALQPVFQGEVFETTAAANPGSDGGPFLDGSGQLIGMLTLNTSDARWLGCAVPIEVLLPKINEAIEKDNPKEPSLKIAKKAGKPLYPEWEARAVKFRKAAAEVADSVVAIKIKRKKDDPRYVPVPGQRMPGGMGMRPPGAPRRRPPMPPPQPAPQQPAPAPQPAPQPQQPAPTPQQPAPAPQPQPVPAPQQPAPAPQQPAPAPQQPAPAPQQPAPAPQQPAPAPVPAPEEQGVLPMIMKPCYVAEAKPAPQPAPAPKPAQPPAPKPEPPQPPQPPRPDPREEMNKLMAEMVKRPDAPVTGVIVDMDGWILTSYFNVAGEIESLTVILPDGRELPATLTGWDQESDLALLKVDAKGLRPVRFSKETSIGSYVCAIGRSPDPKRITLTTGIVSAIGRNLSPRLQFDAKANVGNTGGALIDLNGNCLGLVGYISLTSVYGQNSGIAFSTFGQTLEDVIKEMKGGSKIVKHPRGNLGIMMAEGAKGTPGVLIAELLDKSPAQNAGLLKGDAILRIDNLDVRNSVDIMNIIRSHKPGDTVVLTVRREGQEQKISVVLGEAEQ